MDKKIMRSMKSKKISGFQGLGKVEGEGISRIQGTFFRILKLFYMIP
jgi:hypothetical protein